jgi:cytochrome oxidase Cu insertion factor (SCO1/SenC/PrrC family)
VDDVPGMGTGLKTNDTTIVGSFHSALLHQGLIVLLILAVAGVTLNVLRSLQFRRATRAGTEAGPGPARPTHLAESPARRLLRISFGLIWVFDGILQGQSSMPLGLVPQGIQPAASASPTWVQHVVHVGTTAWSYHPVQAAAAAVWIQIGIGLWLLIVPRGRWSRLGGVVSLGWGLVVWVFGEAFGGIFAPGLTWLFGAPGAALFYCAAGALIALPERAWLTPRLGRIVLRVMGVFFVAMAVLQAWPGRGFWSGRTHSGGSGTLTGMVQAMSQISQPRVLASWVRGFASFDAAHGWGVNLFAVLALALVGAGLLVARPRVTRVAVVATVVLCVADWVLVEDFGFFGGIGTDPNSMIPLALVVVAGYVALVRPTAVSAVGVVPIVRPPAEAGTWRQRLVTNPGYAFRFIAALAALGIVLVGGVPMAVAAASPNADPILATAVDGTPDTLHYTAPAFHLVDQHDRAVSLASLRGKTVALTFLDPVCTSDCPIIAQEFRQADAMLGADADQVDLVAIDANPRFTAPDDLAAFDAHESLTHLPNWLYLTGAEAQLQRIWGDYGILVGYASGGAMIAHSDTAYVINRHGGLRYVLNADPGSDTSATRSSFAATLADTITRTIDGS